MIEDIEASKKEIGSAEVSQICAKHRIEIKDLKSTIGSFDKKIFFINNDFILRVSATTMEGEQEKFRRVAVLNYVPEIKHVGVLESKIGPIHPISGLGSPRLQAWGGEVGQSDEGGLDDQLLP